MVNEKYLIKVENANKFEQFEEEVIELIRKYELSYVEAVGILELMKVQLGESFLNEE